VQGSLFVFHRKRYILARQISGVCLQEKDMVQTIGFIGSGMISSQVARLATAAGFNVILSNSRGPETLADLVEELGSRARAATSDVAARDSDLSSLAIFAVKVE
jgi:predicted dinucleotide-binding enzyme